MRSIKREKTYPKGDAEAPHRDYPFSVKKALVSIVNPRRKEGSDLGVSGAQVPILSPLFVRCLEEEKEGPREALEGGRRMLTDVVYK